MRIQYFSNKSVGIYDYRNFFLTSPSLFFTCKIKFFKNLWNQFKHYLKQGWGNRDLYKFIILLSFVIWTWVIVLALIFKVLCYLFLCYCSPFFTLGNSLYFVLPILFYSWIAYHFVIITCVILEYTGYFTRFYVVFDASDDGVYDNFILKPYARLFGDHFAYGSRISWILSSIWVLPTIVWITVLWFLISRDLKYWEFMWDFAIRHTCAW